jgi:pimeloyl-ACP methyl ester carboxylesterase
MTLMGFPGTMSLVAVPLLALLPFQAPNPATAAPQRFTVSADGHPMAVWGRVPANARKSVLLIHGRTWSSRPDFDLQVPGLKRSVMQSFADRGIAAYAIDLRGYGETPRDATGFNTPARAAADVAIVLKWVAGQHPRLEPPAMLGWSNGAVVAMHVAQTQAPLVSHVTLFGFTPSPEYELAAVPSPAVAPKVKNTAEAARSDFITLAVTPPAVIRAFVTQALAADPIFAEWKNEEQWNVLRAERLTTPFMILHGSRDPGADPEAAAAFMAAAIATTRSYVVLPGADHAAQIEDTHEMFMSVVTEFITRPKNVRVLPRQ